MEPVEVACRSCRSTDLVSVISFGPTPLAGRLVAEEHLPDPEVTAPLDLVFCPTCALLQIAPDAPLPSLDGAGRAATSPALRRHFEASAAEIIATRKLGPKSFVIELASAEGSMLGSFVEAGIPVLGIDAREGSAREAQKRGVPTLNTSFTPSLAAWLRGQRMVADVVLTHDVLGTAADLNGFVDAVRLVLADDGVALVEVPYVVDLISRGEIDAISHRYRCYFSVTALPPLFRRHGLYLKDVRRVPVHGGTLRLLVGRHRGATEAVSRMLKAERELGVPSLAFYRDFAHRVPAIRSQLRDILLSLKARDFRIAAYGAVAEAMTLLNYVGIDRQMVDYVVDPNVSEHGKYLPGNHLPVYPADRLGQDRPDFVLLLARDVLDEDLREPENYRRQGGHFIVPTPQPRIV